MFSVDNPKVYGDTSISDGIVIIVKVIAIIFTNVKPDLCFNIQLLNGATVGLIIIAYIFISIIIIAIISFFIIIAIFSSLKG